MSEQDRYGRGRAYDGPEYQQQPSRPQGPAEPGYGQHEDYGQHQDYGQPPDPRRYEQRPLDPREARAAGKAERARMKAMRPWYAKKRWWAVGALVVLVGIAAAAGGGDDGGGSDEPAAAENGGQDVYAIGQTAHTGEFDVTVHTLEDPFTPGQFETPAAGHRFVGVELTVTNSSDGPLPFSTLAGVELIDQADRPWDITIAGLDRPQIDALTVAPGEARRGWVVFSAPADATKLTLRVKGNLTATGSLFALN